MISIQAPSADGWVCDSHTIVATVPDAGAGASYQWILPTPAIGRMQILSGQGTRIATFASYLFHPDSLGVSVSDGCGSSSSTVTITPIVPAQEQPSLSFDPSGHRPIYFPFQPPHNIRACANGTYTMTAEHDGATIDPTRVYNWQLTGGTIVSGQGTPTVTFNAGPAGTTLTWSLFAADRCQLTSPLLTETWDTLAPPPTVRITGPPYVEPASAENVVKLIDTPGVIPLISDFHWTVQNGGVLNTSELQALPLVFTAGSGGYVTVTANMEDACNTSYAPMLHIPIRSLPPMIAVPPTVCMSAETAASVSPQPSATYVWTLAGGHLTGGQGTPQVTFVPDGDAQLVLTADVNAASYTSVIDVVPSPNANISAPASVAPGSPGNQASVDDAGLSAQYQWDIENGVVTGTNGRFATYTAGASGAVTLTAHVSTFFGCVSVSSTSVPIVCVPWTPSDLRVTMSGSTAACNTAAGGPCAPGEPVTFGVQGTTHVADSCDDVTWHVGTATYQGPTLTRTFTAPGMYVVSAEVRNARGTATAQLVVGIAGPHRRAATR